MRKYTAIAAIKCLPAEIEEAIRREVVRRHLIEILSGISAGENKPTRKVAKVTRVTRKK